MADTEEKKAKRPPKTAEAERPAKAEKSGKADKAARAAKADNVEPSAPRVASATSGFDAAWIQKQ